MAAYKCAIISKYLCSKASSILILSYKISIYAIYEDSFEAKILRDDCTLSV